jgi:hypothetical protein
MLFLPALPDTDVVSRVAVVEGYNSNTYQAQDDPNKPLIERHPSLFTGIDGNLELRWLGRDTDRTTLNLDARANHYEPLQREYQSDDGAFTGAFSTTHLIAPRTTWSVVDTGAVTSFNAAHVTDGTIFAFDPTQERSTYWINDVSTTIAHQMTPTLRLTQGVGATISGTLASAPTLAPNGQNVEHRGLDYVMPYMETDLNEDFTSRTSGDLMLLYQYALQEYVVDFTQTPPRNIGPDKQAFLTLLAGWTHHWNADLSTVVRGGGVLGSAPPRDIDQRAILSPAGELDFYFTRPFFEVVASSGYTWGTINPRLGDGPTASGSLLAIGVPHHVGKWQNLALMATAQASYSTLITGVTPATGATQATRLGLYAVGGQVRYGLNRWLGVLGGYDLRYATFATPGQFNPPFLQQVFWIGLGGYWANDRTILPLTRFAAPVTPPS